MNTGGTTGQPMSFYVDKEALGREWAHIHYLWKQYGYKSNKLMITALGKKIGDKPFVYHAVNNEFLINPVIGGVKDYLKLFELIIKYKIHFFQGYPSNIYKIMKDMKAVLSLSDFEILTSYLQICFLSSESTPQYMQDFLQKDCKLKLVTWYGHSEMCIFACDKDCENNYIPMYSYGFPEEINGKLVGTSTFNFDMPLIRYETDDVVSAKYNSLGYMSSFKMLKGRESDYIIDKFGKKISLTTNVFGQHHKIFNLCDFVQVIHDKQGELIFLISGLVPEEKKYNFFEFFDLDGFDFDFEFKEVSKPIRSKRGKLKLRINNIDLNYE